MNVMKMSSCKGQSLVGVLMSITITGISILALMSMFNFYNKEMRAINEKLSILDLEKSLINTLADGSVCTFELTQLGAWHLDGATVPMTFDASKIGSATPPVINLKQILLQGSPTSPILAEVNKPAGLNANSAVVRSIELANIEGSAAGNIFAAKIKVTMDSEKLVRSLQPIYIHQTLLTSGTGNLKTITGCGSGEASNNLFLCVGMNPGNPINDPDGEATYTYNVSCVRLTDGALCTGMRDSVDPRHLRWRCPPTSPTYYPWPGGGPWSCYYTESMNGGPRSAYMCLRTSDGLACHPSYKTDASGMNVQAQGWKCVTSLGL